jgi:hypothetical protein
MRAFQGKRNQLNAEGRRSIPAEGFLRRQPRRMPTAHRVSINARPLWEEAAGVLFNIL